MHCAFCPRQEDRFGSDYFARLDTNDCLEAFGFFFQLEAELQRGFVLSCGNSKAFLPIIPIIKNSGF